MTNLLKYLARPSVLQIAQELNAFDRWAYASGFNPEEPDAADFYQLLRGKGGERHDQGQAPGDQGHSSGASTG